MGVPTERHDRPADEPEARRGRGSSAARWARSSVTPSGTWMTSPSEDEGPGDLRRRRRPRAASRPPSMRPRTSSGRSLAASASVVMTRPAARAASEYVTVVRARSSTWMKRRDTRRQRRPVVDVSSDRGRVGLHRREVDGAQVEVGHEQLVRLGRQLGERARARAIRSASSQSGSLQGGWLCPGRAWRVAHGSFSGATLTRGRPPSPS